MPQNQEFTDTQAPWSKFVTRFLDAAYPREWQDDQSQTSCDSGHHITVVSVHREPALWYIYIYMHLFRGVHGYELQSPVRCHSAYPSTCLNFRLVFVESLVQTVSTNHASQMSCAVVWAVRCQLNRRCQLENCFGSLFFLSKRAFRPGLCSTLVQRVLFSRTRKENAEHISNWVPTWAFQLKLTNF